MTSVDDELALVERRASLLAAYDSQLREEAEVAFAIRVDRDGPLFRAVFEQGTGFVSYRSLAGYDTAGDGSRLDQLIARTIAYFEHETDVTEFEWKTRSHDLPSDLGARLHAQGLVAQEQESVMVGEAALLAADHPLPLDVTLRRVGFDADGTRHSETRIRADIAAVLETQRLAFERPIHQTVDSMYSRVVEHPESVELWVAVATDAVSGDQTVISTGRLVTVPGTEFAGIWGGATLPAWRLQGIYRALTAARAGSALTKGIRYLQSDSTDYSKPILERSGFLHITSTTPYVWTRPA